ncbi:MAG: aminoglycoside phosphotransferase family protein [Lachnospiraceae bacterium]
MKKIGNGRTADVFEWQDGKVCKLFRKGYPQEYVKIEYHNARILFDLGISVPEPYETIHIDGRDGIVYEKINGKTLSGYLSDVPGNMSDVLEVFVNEHRKLLHYHSRELLSYKDFLAAMIGDKAEDTCDLRKEISALPDGDNVLHGDFHPDNLMVNSEGKIYIIDFMNVCCGPALFDIARSYFLLKGVNESAGEEYLSKMQAAKKDLAVYLSVIEACRQYEG